jgi:hypothetical protein
LEFDSVWNLILVWDLIWSEFDLNLILGGAALSALRFRRGLVAA